MLKKSLRKWQKMIKIEKKKTKNGQESSKKPTMNRKKFQQIRKKQKPNLSEFTTAYSE